MYKHTRNTISLAPALLLAMRTDKEIAAYRTILE